MAVYWNNKWVRGCIESPDPSGQNNIVRLLDYGGYWQFSNMLFKPIKFEYLQLPFQAIEVFLANIQAKEGNCILILHRLVFRKVIFICPKVVFYIIIRFIRVL